MSKLVGYGKKKDIQNFVWDICCRKIYLEDRKGDAMTTCNWTLRKKVVKMENGYITSGCSSFGFLFQWHWEYWWTKCYLKSFIFHILPYQFSLVTVIPSKLHAHLRHSII